jgi:methionyl-tRNA synthetase
MSEYYYITTPIYYVNDVPHIGHAYTTVACDVLARFMRLDGYKVKFVTGTDEHGQKVANSAAARRVPTQDFVDEYSQHFVRLNKILGCSNDDFIRTTEVRHTRAVEELWRRLEKNIYLGKYSGWYSVRDEAFYGAEEIIDGKAPTGAPVEWVEEPSYFFNLSEWQQKLLKFYSNNPDFVVPASRVNEVVSFVKSGLRDLSISRLKSKIDWGIPVPGNSEHVIYVWVDALANYLSVLGFPETQNNDYEVFWQTASRLTPLHIVGKDILRFHAVYWPAFLMAAGLPLPKRIMAHGWWTNEGQKISKSLGNVIDPFAIVDDFGLDQVRYFLLREISFGNDGDFSKESLIMRANTELANNIGNLAQRTLSMLHKHFDGRLPAEVSFVSEDNALLDKAYSTINSLRPLAEKQQLHIMIEKIINLSAAANHYIAVQAPWALADRPRMGTVLYTLAESIRCIAIMLQPFIPGSAAKMLDQLRVEEKLRSFASLKNSLPLGGQLGELAVIFPKFKI